MRIDAHHHLWDPEVVDYAWLGPELAPLNRATVVVQAANSADDTDYLLREAAASDWIAAVVGWVDLRRPATVRAALTDEVRHPKFRGVRHLLDDEPSRWGLEAEVLESLRIVAESGLALDIPALFPSHLETIPELARRVDGLLLVLDHLGSPRPGDDKFDSWSRRLTDVASFPNVYAKLSGLRTVVTDGKRASEAIAPYVEHALSVFSHERLMWGSDWPVSLLAWDYWTSWQLVEDAVHACSPSEVEAIFGGTAAHVYRIQNEAAV